MSELDAFAEQEPNRVPLRPDALAGLVTLLGARWTHESDVLVLSLFAKGMTNTGRVAAYAGELADSLDHHPTIAIGYPGLKLTINTHDVHAITSLDSIYCARLEQWLRSNYDTIV